MQVQVGLSGKVIGKADTVFAFLANFWYLNNQARYLLHPFFAYRSLLYRLDSAGVCAIVAGDIRKLMFKRLLS